MAFYYVRNDGTCGDGGDSDDGRHATLQIGDWDTTLGAVSNWYPSVESVVDLTTSQVITNPVGGDYIIVSDIHTEGNGVIFQIQATKNTIGPLKLVSVDDTEIETAKKGASVVDSTNSVSWQFFDFPSLYGFDFTFTGNVGYITIGDNEPVILNNVSYTSEWTIPLAAALEGRQWILNDCDITATDVGALAKIETNEQGIIEIRGGTLNGTGWDQDGFIDPSGGIFNLNGVDLTGIPDGTLDYLAKITNSASVVPNKTILYGCAYDQTLIDYAELYPSKEGAEIFVVKTSEADGVDPNTQFYIKSWTGELDLITTDYRDDSAIFSPSDEQGSLKIDTNSVCDRAKFFHFQIPTQFCRLSSTDTDVLRFYFSSNTAGLTTADVYALVGFVDGADKSEYNYVTNAPTVSSISVDILDDGVAHPADGSAWTNGGTNKYRMDVLTSATGADCVPWVDIFITLPSITIYFDTEFDTV